MQRGLCCVVSREATVTTFCLNMQSHIWLNMHSHSHEANGTTRLIYMQSRSREATVMPRRRGVAASVYYYINDIFLIL